jgi:K+-sensing histidine kinase KdpD
MGAFRRFLAGLERRPVRARDAVLGSVLSVAMVTAAIYALRPLGAPVLSLGVLYLFAVLPVAALWRLPYALVVAVVSMLTFNWLFLPPHHTFHLAQSENWIALAVYLATAIGVSALADRASRRAAEAERLLAQLRASVREREVLAREDAAKTAILRSISHDLRSPITAILAASEVLEHQGAAEADELLASIRLQARRLDRLVGNLLELSRLEAGAALPVPEVWPVDSLVARALDAIGPANERVDVLLPDELAPVLVDPAQIEHALVNLIENALRVSPPGRQVAVRAANEDGSLVIRVQDHGPGVAAADRERIFEAFERGGSGEGTGLGLAIARGFVELNGGRLAVEPSADGAVFALVLPAVAAPAPAIA